MTTTFIAGKWGTTGDDGQIATAQIFFAPATSDGMLATVFS
jgi:hypothetical protein